MSEVGELAGPSRNTVKKRLDKIESRIYRDLEKQIPTEDRSRGKRILSIARKNTLLFLAGGGVSSSGLTAVAKTLGITSKAALLFSVEGEISHFSALVAMRFHHCRQGNDGVCGSPSAEHRPSE